VRIQIERAKWLRQNMTEAEARLWCLLRAHRFQGYKFKRQKPIGPYIVDFVCMQHRVIIEVDGGQHQDRREYDQERDAWLRRRGYAVLRFWNHEVMGNLEGVLEAILQAMQARALSPAPSPASGRGEVPEGSA
jgi:very-short-patch-repair endonuclease